MWPALAVAMVGLLALVVGFWMGRQSSRSESQAGQTMLEAATAVSLSADRALEQAMKQAGLAQEMDSIREQVKAQTASLDAASSALEKLDANVFVMTEAMLQRGMVRKPTPRQVGETTTNPPPPMPLERIPSAKNPSSPASSAPPIVTG